MLKQTGPRTDARYAGNRNSRQENFFLFLKQFAEEKVFCRSVIGDKPAHMNAGARSRRLSIETKVITGFSLAVLLVHLLTNQRYGYFRDELYFIAFARQLDFGYVDLAPFSALMLRIDLMLFATSLFALRLFPAIAGAFIVALTGALARQLRGRAWAAALSCTATLCALVYLSIGNFYFAQCLRTIALDWLRLPARSDHQRRTTAFVALVRSLRRTWTGEQTFDRLFLLSLWSQAFC